MKRKAVDGTIRTYRFWARPLNKVPNELWQIGHKSQRFWNRLVNLREEIVFSCETLPENAHIVEARFWDLLTSKEPDCKRWRQNAKDQTELPWAVRDAVFDRFVKCCIRAARGNGNWPTHHKSPKRINVLHRFTNGGRAVHNIFINRRAAWRFGLSPVPEWTYEGKTRHHTINNSRLSSGFFGLSKDIKIHFRTVLHRQLPEKASVKNVIWMGNLHPLHGWKWAIAIVLKIDSTCLQPGSSLVCGIDLGWRIREDYIRVGVLSDSQGYVLEMRLPLDSPTAKTRRHKLPCNYRDLIRIDSEIDGLVNDTKAMIKSLVSLPGNVQGTLELASMRETGLRKLLIALESSGQSPAAQKILKQWLINNERLCSLGSAIRERLIGRRKWRKWLYRNIAAWLTKTYSAIALEDKFAAKAMIGDTATKDKDRRFQRSIRYYQWAAVAELRTYIVEAAAKNGARIVETETRWSTATCFICGRYTPHRSDLILTCPSGHTWDQDVNASSIDSCII